MDWREANNMINARTRTNRALHVLLAMLTLAVISHVDSYAQVKSDLEVKQSFERKIEDVRKSILMIVRTVDADSLLAAVNDIELEFSDKTDFLNQVFEPRTVDAILGDLRNLIAIQRSQLQTIDSQREEIVVLNQRISGITDLLQFSNLQADSLRKVISRTNASREVMSNLVRDYRSRLDERDLLIRLFVDSLIVTYDDPRLREMLGTEQRVRVNRLSNSDDALKMIQTIIDDNIEVISGSTEFDAPFYLKMDNLHYKIEDMWTKLGLTISSVYLGKKDAEKVNQAINSKLLTWKQRLRGAMWSSMYRSFSDNGILLMDFDSETEFVSSVNAYLDTTLVRVNTGVTEADFRNYELFKQFWTKDVKANWAPLMLESKLITMEEITEIDQKVEDWGSIARPRSDNLYLYLGISLVIIIGMAIMLINARRNTVKAQKELAESIKRE
jgi:hypothetical protein